VDVVTGVEIRIFGHRLHLHANHSDFSACGSLSISRSSGDQQRVGGSRIGRASRVSVCVVRVGDVHWKPSPQLLSWWRWAQWKTSMSKRALECTKAHGYCCKVE
jgi:hypothetical protein